MNPLTKKDKDLFLKICLENDINYKDFQDSENRPLSDEQLTDSSSSCFSDIFLGLYKNRELKVASFFHELGHILNGKEHIKNNTEGIRNIYLQEVDAWKTGFKESQKYGYFFNGATLDWCFSQLMTYEKQLNPHYTELTKICPICKKEKFKDEFIKYSYGKNCNSCRKDLKKRG